MKRTFLAFALAVTLVASLAACSSRPADTNTGTNNNGTTNNGTTNNGTANNGTANSGTANSGTGSVEDDVIIDDGIMDDEFADDGVIDDDLVDDDIVDAEPVPPVTPNTRSRSAVRRSGTYAADRNGNLADWDDDATIGDAARTAVDGVMNGVRRAGAAVGDTLKGDR